MVKYLYENFLTDDAHYHSSEKFWADLCDDVLKQYSIVDDWKSWCSKTLLDGTPLRDGNPIHDLVSASTSKGIRIIQIEPGELGNDIIAYTDTIGGDPGEEDTWDDLVVTCELSEESAELARQLLIEWVQYEGPRQEFEPTIARILGW